MEYNQLYFEWIGAVTIPRSIKYVAQSENGQWYGFTFKPIQSEDDIMKGCWDWPDKELPDEDSESYPPVIFIGRSKPPGNWEDQLWEIHWV